MAEPTDNIYAAVVGVPGPWMTLGVSITKLLVEAAVGPVHLLTTLDEKGAAPAKGTGRASILVSERPSATTADAIVAASIPTIVFVTSPEVAVGLFLKERKLSPVDAMRQASLLFAVQDGLIASERTLVLSDLLQSLSALDAAFAMAAHLRLPLGRQDVEKAIAGQKTVSPSQAVFAAIPELAGLFDDRIPEPERTTIATCLAGWSRHRNGRQASQFEWPPNAHMASAQPNAPLVAPVDMLGAARILIYGPYLGLPRGEWKAEITFRVAQNFSGNVLHVDVASKDFLGRAAGALPPQATMTCSIDFEVQNATLPHEIRMSIQEGAIEGELELLSVRIKTR